MGKYSVGLFHLVGVIIPSDRTLLTIGSLGSKKFARILYLRQILYQGDRGTHKRESSSINP